MSEKKTMYVFRCGSKKIFLYEKREEGEQNHVYRNCVFLSDTDRYKRGDRVDSITIRLDMTVWKGESYEETEIYI